MATAEFTVTAASDRPAANPLHSAARMANRLWQQLRDAFVEADAAGEQMALEELLESVENIERRLYRLAGCPVAHSKSPNRPR